ncbi:MAG: phosphatidate cytidylyltransferase [Alicyclobacillaceae bacterium]|nr:phosphatidate cytidylyltransferase [Alicyclobacillaceae bacterium]
MLRQRVLTAAIGIITIFVILILPTSIPWAVLVFLVTGLGVMEFAQMYGATYRSPIAYAAVLATAYIEFSTDWYRPLSLFLMVAIALLWPVATKNRQELGKTSPIFIGALYVGIGGMSLMSLRSLAHGPLLVWALLISVFMSDTCAFFVGRWLKGPLMWPEISPKKTWSGAIGGILGAGMAAWIFGMVVGNGVSGGIGYFILGLCLSILSQLGDLIESAYKRSTGVKDSGWLLPGHGGVLDRIDSLLFAAPLMLWFATSGVMNWLHIAY